jgi:hypothetical protein
MCLALGNTHKSSRPSTPHTLLDADSRIIAVLAGRPHDENWEFVIKQSENAFDHARTAGYQGGLFAPTGDIRGDFPKLSSGYSFGGGQKVCPSLTIAPSHTHIPSGSQKL